MEAGCNSDKIEMYLLTLPFGIRISPLQHRRSKAYRGSLTSPAGALYSAAPVIVQLFRLIYENYYYEIYLNEQKESKLDDVSCAIEGARRACERTSVCL